MLAAGAVNLSDVQSMGFEERAMKLAALMVRHLPGDIWPDEDMSAAAMLLSPRGGEELAIVQGPHRGRVAVLDMRPWNRTDDGEGPHVCVLVRSNGRDISFHGCVRLGHFSLAARGRELSRFGAPRQPDGRG